ncbi:S-methyl-5-thioribose-1-phosphate isomerase [Halobacteriovorax marinus]|uniref:S-methyl-5-thioribose-1-phosphate isomerase n=1 Tax=Halobacteriovorax marinus TaxID=97084 RepID=A0A1Y5F1V7_9BACT|nr:S-methyl-5-thioribose-1-phosphate isomerase [Halobacteriovorax marinus]
MSSLINPLIWDDGVLKLLDQRKLPLEETIVECRTHEDAFNGIRDMVVRGAPLIGYTGIFGMALFAKGNRNTSIEELQKAADYLNSSRPTAVNLNYELRRCVQIAKDLKSSEGSLENLEKEFVKFGHEQLEIIHTHNLSMAKIAQKDLEARLGKKKFRIMTLCNTGYLACGPMGTALGVIAHLANNDQIEHVYASETRPYLQGIRLTSYELKKQNIPHDVVCEGSFSYLMKKGLIDAIFIGADRIVRNGDTANKIGSSTLSIVAKHYNVPFFVVAPTSSFDFESDHGDQIPIELRDQDEILFCKGQRLAPEGVSALNPSFDVTDANCISGIICEKGLIDPVTKENLLKVTGRN